MNNLNNMTNSSSTLKIKQLTFSGAAIALAVVISTFIKLPSLPAGGSITLFSMMFICLIGYFFGPICGLSAALAYGILQFIIGPYVVHPIQVILDYPLAFGALGLSGFFCSSKHGLIKGYIAGVLGRLFFCCISGIFFYTAYVGNLRGDIKAIWVGILYNCSYILPEMILTLILISIPAVNKAINYIKCYALQN